MTFKIYKTTIKNTKETITILPLAQLTQPRGRPRRRGGGPIAASAASATFTRLAGGGYFIGSGSGIYGSFGTVSYGISDVTPIPNLANLIFQARMNLAPSSITLNLNGGSPLTPGFTDSTAAGSGSFGPISDFAWQWDLSAFAGAINHYQITVDFPENSLVYGNAPDPQAVNLEGKQLHFPANARYPWRITPIVPAIQGVRSTTARRKCCAKKIVTI